MRKWTMTTIKTNAQANDMIELFHTQHPKVGAFDTETNGLHIIVARPFLFQFGWLDPIDARKGYTFVVDLERQPQLAHAVIGRWNTLALELAVYLAHNVKYDMHMLTNVGLQYSGDNLSDTMYYIRAGHDCLTVDNGGPPLKLKDYAVRYITRDAKDHDRLLQTERTERAKELNLCLKVRMVQAGRPPARLKAASWTLGALKDFFKDKTMEGNDLPTEAARQAYRDWLNLDVPAEIRPFIRGLVDREDIPYNWLNRSNLIHYAHYDIVWVLEIYESLCPIITTRKTWNIIETENQLIWPLFEMERTGFAANKEYLLTAKEEVKQYILQQRRLLYQEAGCVFSIAQKPFILKLLADLDVFLTSTEDEQLSRAKNDLKKTNNGHPAIRIIELIQELRTLEKWYSTYILRFEKDLMRSDRLYTTINSVGAVSGRVTSDFQQFPKAALKTEDGRELFHPRRLIQATGDNRKAIVYLDFSQIELRFQALYTILVGHPDLNLCRAYMPYKCHDADGVPFDYNNPQHIKRWHEPWFLDEQPGVRWTATDVHGATTKAAFGIDESNPDFHMLRYVGKRVNFAKLNLDKSSSYKLIPR